MKIILALLGVLLTVYASASGQTKDDGIQYNATYDCPRSSVRNFKVLKCNANGWCDVFFVNSSPEGGYKDELKKTRIQELLTIGCEIDGKPVKLERRRAETENESEAADEDSQTAETDAETIPDCPFNEPAGKVSGTAKASEALFKRVIFERYEGQESGRRVGITFQTFRLGKSFVNRLTNNGLLNDAAPQNATIYPVKAKFIKCVQYTNAVQRTVMESDYACFKDKFGDWVCGVDSVPKIIEQTEIPNK